MTAGPDPGSTGAVARGARGVAIAGDVVNSVIVTGDNVSLNVQLDGADGALLERLAAREVPEPVPLPTPLASRPPRFANHVDREEEAAAVVAGARDAGSTNVYGEPGIGKSHLLSHVANGPEAEALPDGVVYVPAGGEPLDDVLQALFEEFYDGGEPPVRPSRSRLRRALRDKRALVVVDALDLDREEAQELVAAAPGCRFLVASTERCLWDAQPLRLEGLALAHALELVEQELGRPLEPAERDDAERLCNALGGHPWRIREAVSRARDEGIPLAAVLGEAEPGGVLETLTPEERRVVAVLAAVGGASVGLEHLRELAGDVDLERTLAGLEARHLIRSGSPRYSLAEPLVGEVERAWDLDPVRERALEHFTSWAEDARGDPRALLTEWPSLGSLLGWAGETSRDGPAIRLGRAVEAPLAGDGKLGAWGDVARIVRDAARGEGDLGVEAWALHQQGTRAVCLGATRQGVADLEQALRIRERIGDRHGAAASRHNLDVALSTLPWQARIARRLGRLGPRLVGLTVAAVLVAAAVVVGSLAYDRLREDTAPVEPGAPGAVLVEVPDVVGLPVEEAIARLEAGGFEVSEAREFSPEPEGVVVGQDPAGGSEVEEGSAVGLVVSGGPELVDVPNVVGLPEEDALVRLEDAGLQVSLLSARFEDIEPGIVAAQDPAEGLAPLGSAVEVTVSLGPTPDLQVSVLRVFDHDCSTEGCFTSVVFLLTNASRGVVEETFDVVVEATGVEPETIRLEGFGPGERRTITHDFGPQTSCFQPDCAARVTVDAGDAVPETDEENNADDLVVIG